MTRKFSLALTLGFVALLTASSAGPAWALEMDWAGQFRSEVHTVRGYTMDATDAGTVLDATRLAAGGYYVAPGGARDTFFQNLFLRLKPKLTVNDNIYIKSEFWVGDPIYGIFGGSTPYTVDQKQFYSNQLRSSTFSAQRFWGEFVTDIGTLVVGRAPLQWGLGAVYNSGEGQTDRYLSTGDQIRMTSKFGAFSVSPAFIKYSAGNNVGGSCSVGTVGATVPAGPLTCTPSDRDGGVTDYSLSLKYENTDEDLEGGVNYIRRIAGGGQDTASGFRGYDGQGGAAVYNVWDIYGRKKFGAFTLAGEFPLVSGTLGPSKYDTFAVAVEAAVKIKEVVDIQLRGGYVPGQASGDSAQPKTFTAVYFHQNNHLGLIMNRYQLANFRGPNTLNTPGVEESSLLSPYDAPITNAYYASLGGAYHLGKWDFRLGFAAAAAVQVAVDGAYFLNETTRTFVKASAGVNQERFKGWEVDFGTSFRWDDNFSAHLDAGWWFPGAFYAFSNAATANAIAPVFAAVARLGVNF